MIVYVITEYFPNTPIEPIITIYDNAENANKCFETFKEQGKIVCIDECPIYKTFKTQ